MIFQTDMMYVIEGLVHNVQTVTLFFHCTVHPEFIFLTFFKKTLIMWVNLAEKFNAFCERDSNSH